MVLYLGDKELYDFISGIYPDTSMEVLLEEAEKIIISEYSYNAVSLIRSAAERNIPILGILDGYRTITEAFGGECVYLTDCSEGKQELVVLDTSISLHRNLAHVVTICRGNAFAVNEETIPPEFDCIARAETGEIISICIKNKNIFAVNYYLNSPLTKHGDIILSNFLNQSERL